MAKVDLAQIVKQSFTQYAGAVIQSRALVDVRDFVKPSARQIYYCMYTDKFTHDKPFKKTLKAIGSSTRLYIHGDASCEGIIMRSGQPFSMRYPLIEVEGSFGNLTEGGNWAAPRYTASRLSALAEYLMEDTSQHSVDEWVDNYDDTEKYPRVLASKGFYNIVNGSSGIAVGTAGSIPQFNLTQVNNALISLLENPEIDFEDIYCPPDFATGGTIINADETKQSIKSGSGKACIIRGTIEVEDNNCIVVTELPYGVYANTVCKEIQKLADEDKLHPAIQKFNDLTGEQACIKIYISKKTDPQDVIDYLYENTSLQKSYSINMTMLKDGRFPKIFGWKEALQEHLNHERIVYTNGYKYELQELKYRLKIIEGIIKAISSIEEVINIVKQAESTKSAAEGLKALLDIDDDQAKAILNIKLARLARLEVQNYLDEQSDLQANIERITNILADDELLKKEMIKKFKEVINKFGDNRRTQIKNIVIQKKAKNGSVKSEQPVEDVVITYNPIGYLQRIPVSMYKRTNFQSFKLTTEDLILLFSNQGRFFRISPRDIKSCGIRDKGTAIGAIIKLNNNEKIISVFSTIIDEHHPYLTFVLNNGIIKKSEKVEFLGTTRNLNGMTAIKMKDDSCVVGIQETNGNDIVLGTDQNVYIRFAAKEVRAMGKNAAGVKAINLADGDSVREMVVCEPSDKTITTSIGKINIVKQGRGGKGKRYV